MNRITPLLAILAFAIIAAATAAAAPGAADILTDSGQANANTGQAETVVVGFEAEQYAIDFGVTTVEALRRLDRIPELKKIIQEAVAAESGRAAGWGIVHEPRFGGWVYLVGDTEPTQATKDLVARHSDLYADTGATHTFAELKAAMSNRSNFEAIPASIRDRIAYREIDVRSNSIVVAIDRDQPPARTDETIPITERPIEAMGLPQAARTLEAILEHNTKLPFSVTLGSASKPTSIHGGELVVTNNGGSCTSAFAVVDGTTRGMLSAGHCNVITSHWQSRTFARKGNNYAATHQDTVWGDDGDSSWYTTSQWESDNFHISTTRTRDVTGYESRANMQGDYVCHFGVASGFSCGTVVSTNFDPSYDVCGWWLGCDNRWVKVEGPTLKSCGGDSGGPWFNGRIAYGIQSGTDTGGKNDCTAAGTEFATFTAMNDVLRDLDLELATT